MSDWGLSDFYFVLFSSPKREIIGDICLLRQKIVFLLWKCIDGMSEGTVGLC